MKGKTKTQRSFTRYAGKQLAAIQRLSQEYNGKLGKDHNQVLLELIRHHSDEITDLQRRSNGHYIIETGDLLVLCCELIREAGASLDEIMDNCYRRYYAKLNSLIAAQNKNPGQRRKKRNG
ncbi:MAG: hypothetical protein PHO30_01975 [Candidatus Omnitrophica bacterium]|nr:hypothetical protein [Candidatus Omnitrophota bacterium]